MNQKGKKRLFYVIMFILVLLFVEISFRAFYAVSFKNATILYKPFALIEHYYPGILEVMDMEVSNADDRVDILFLGGSVLTQKFGTVESELKAYLEDSLQREIKIYNLATPAHTSRDSRLKMELLAEQHFDFILLYHGINETRFNNCPKSMFKDNYSHVDFYTKVNAIAKRTWSRFTVIPFIFIQLKTNILKEYAKENYMTMHEPVRKGKDAWLKYGLDVKTAVSFKNNYTYIIKNAKQKGTEVLLPTFAYSIPEDYTLENFKKEFEKNSKMSPIEIWGTTETVAVGIDEHNNVVQELSVNSTYDNILFIDVNEVLRKNQVNFVDVCHFTETGSQKFANMIGLEIINFIEAK